MSDKMKIALCDKEQKVRYWMEEMLQKYMGLRKLEYEFYYYKEGKHFLEDAEMFKIVFLSVEMSGMDGFEIAENLRKRKLEIEIIYLANHVEMAMRAFHVRALRYLKKPCKEEEWTEALEAAFHEFSENRILKIETSSGDIYFENISQVQYMESLGDDSCIYLTEKYIISKKSLKYWEAELEENFFRCHKSYLVNLRMVDKCTEKKIILKSGQEVPLSYRKKKEVWKVIYLYRREKARFY